MKKFYFLVLSFFALSGNLLAQTVTIADNPGISGNIVIGPFNYHVLEAIYTEAEIGAGNFITAGTAIERINFNQNTEGINPVISNFRIYLKNVPLATESFATGTYSLAGYTLVYNGIFDATDPGIVGVTLTTPFVRTAGTNLQMLIERVDNTLHTGNIFDAAIGNNTSDAVLSSRRYNNNTIPTPGVTSLTPSTFRPAIQFIHTFSVDAEVFDIFTPQISCHNSGKTIAVIIYNAGLTPIAAGDATINLSISGAGTFSGALTNPNIVAPGDIDFVLFNGINLNTAGLYNIEAVVNLPGDANTLNNSLLADALTATTINTYPAVEDAETTFPLFGYISVLAFDQLWDLQVGNYTNPDLTGPLVPRAPGNRFYLFDSYSGGNSSGYSSRLYSNCFEIPTNSTALMTFYMSHDNSYLTDLDSIYISVTTDRGATWNRLSPGFQRPDATAATPVWRLESVDLSAYAGQTIQIGFDGVSKYGNVIGIDDITITVNSLPVTLLNFDAQRNGAVNNLKWTTSQEANSSRFIVERSFDGRNFSEIGVVAAAGFSNAERNYRFTDMSPVKGINYYRLRMVDIDDSYKYSSIKNVRNLGAADISFAPNPVQQFIKVFIESEKTEKAQVRITDMSGKVVYSGTYNVVNGANQVSVNTENLSGGTYILQVQLSEGNLVKKFTKL